METKKFIEVWKGTLISGTDSNIITKQDRDKIVTKLKELYTKRLNEGYFGENFKKEEKKEVEYKFLEKDGKKITDWRGVPVCVIKFPYLYLDEINGYDIKCKCGIRINVCTAESISKIWVYIGTREAVVMDPDKTLKFIHVIKKQCEDISNRVARSYTDQTKMHVIDYDINIYNIGSHSPEINRFVNFNNLEEVIDVMKKDKDLERLYLDIVGWSHDMLFKNYEQYTTTRTKTYDWIKIKVNETGKETVGVYAYYKSQGNSNTNKFISEYTGVVNAENYDEFHKVARAIILSFVNTF